MLHARLLARTGSIAQAEEDLAALVDQRATTVSPDDDTHVGFVRAAKALEGLRAARAAKDAGNTGVYLPPPTFTLPSGAFWCPL